MYTYNYICSSSIWYYMHITHINYYSFLSHAYLHTIPFTCLWCTCTYYACMHGKGSDIYQEEYLRTLVIRSYHSTLKWKSVRGSLASQTRRVPNVTNFRKLSDILMHPPPPHDGRKTDSHWTERTSKSRWLCYSSSTATARGSYNVVSRNQTAPESDLATQD